jgi:hypothetical protein
MLPEGLYQWKARTRDLAACSAVSQSPAPPGAPMCIVWHSQWRVCPILIVSSAFTTDCSDDRPTYAGVTAALCVKATSSFN